MEIRLTDKQKQEYEENAIKQKQLELFEEAFNRLYSQDLKTFRDNLVKSLEDNINMLIDDLYLIKEEFKNIENETEED